MERLPEQTEALAISSAVERHARVATLLFTDVVGSTALKQRLGDQAGIELVQQHHRLLRGVISQFPGAQEVAFAGDSFLILFPVPSEAVKCALLLQHRLAQFNREARAPVADRMGLHMGEVVTEGSGGKLEVLGMQVDTCSRVMSLAQAGQILMTRPVFDNARQSLKGEELLGAGALSWLNHGRFELKGVDEPLEICEVRAGVGESLTPPTTSEKARRVEAATGGEAVLGWRPAVGQSVPNTRWLLEEKLGEGGFGEVWKARHDMLKETRVFKFCFQADRVRTLKREVTLFRLLKERIGEHPNIVKLHDIFFDKPPYYLEEEYVAGRDLRNWCEAQGGIQNVTLEAKLELVAQAAEALQAAHDAGVIHRDVKPGNILIRGSPDPAGGPGSLVAKLTDFGIGQVISEEALQGVTRDGFTQTMLSVMGATHTGTQLYMAPELWEGKPASTRSDIYSLGVVLYQLLVGDFKRPLTADWPEDIPDPLLREDLHSCFARKPEDRFAAAGLLARNLRALPTRRSEAERQAREKAALEQAAYRRGIVRTAGIASLVVAVIVVLAWQVWSNAGAKMRQAAQMRSSTVRLTVANGLNPLESGDWLTAALWFSEAFVLDEAFQVSEEPEVTRRTHRLRMNSLLSQSPRLEQVWFDDAGMCGGFDRGGQQLLLGGVKGYKVYRLPTGKSISPPFGQGSLRASLHPDGRRAVTGGGATNSWFALWDVTTGARLSWLMGVGNSSEPFRGDCTDIQFSGDGRWIAAPVSGPRGQVMIWDSESGCAQPLLAYADHPELPWTTNDFITAARFDFSGERLLTADTKNRAVIWQWKTGTVLRVLQGHNSWVYSGCFAHEHTNWVLTCSFDRTARLWALDSGQTLLRVAHEGDSVQEVQFSPDDKMFVTGGLDSMVRFWDSQTGRLIPPVLRNHDRVTQVVWSAEGARVAVTTRDGTARVWRVQNERPVIRSLTSDFSSDGRLMLKQNRTQASVQDLTGKRALRVCDLGSTNMSGLFFGGSPDRFLWFATLPGAHGAGRTELQLCEWTGGRVGKPLAYDPAWNHFVCAPSGRRFAFWRDIDEEVMPPPECGVLVWEPERSANPRFIRCGNEPVDSAAFDEPGRRLVIGSHLWRSDSGVLRWVDLESAGDPQVFTRSKQQFVHLAFSPDGQWLAAAESDKSLDPGVASLWPVGENGPMVQQPSRLPQRDGVLCTAFSDSSQMLVTASEDQTAFIWRRIRGSWQPSARPLRCGGEVHACVFSHNERWVATAHRTPESQQARRWRSNVRIWDTANNEPVSVPFAFPEKITRLVFVDDDHRLLVERWVPPAAPQRWLIDLGLDQGSAKELLLRAELLSSQRSFLSAASPRLPRALGGTPSTEQALLHATSFGPSRPLSKEDCRELWLQLSSPSGTE